VLGHGAYYSAHDPDTLASNSMFGTTVQTFHKKTAPATDINRKRASTWIDSVGGLGGTDLASGLAEGIDVLDGPGFDLFLITDGEVSETGPIIEQMSASGTRVHILGVGNAGQDRFLASLARRSGGIQRQSNSDEDVATMSLELFNAVRTPRQKNVVADVELTDGSHQKHTFDVVWNNRALVITDNGQSGTALPVKVDLTWDGNTAPLMVDLIARRPVADGVLALAWAGQQVEDLEAALDMCKSGPARKATEQDLKKISTDYGLASRVMSLVAVHKRIGDQAGVDPKQRMVPVGMPNDREGMAQTTLQTTGLRAMSMMFATNHQAGPTGVFYNNSSNYSPPGSYTASVNSLVLRDSSMSLCSDTDDASDVMKSASPPHAGGQGFLRSAGSTHSTNGGGNDWSGGDAKKSRPTAMIRRVSVRSVSTPPPAKLAKFAATMAQPERKRQDYTNVNPSDTMATMASIEADGGLPGSDLETRVTRTALFALGLLQQKTAIYRAHLKRMAKFLEAHADVADFIPRLIPLLMAGTQQVDGSWMDTFRTLSTSAINKKTTAKIWHQVSTAV
jgi:hypothetical protein